MMDLGSSNRFDIDSPTYTTAVGAATDSIIFEKEFPTPKLTSRNKVGRQAWYPYYAGFSTSFVTHVLEELGSRDLGLVCDPWNGAGTTTDAAGICGFNSIGFDINPVMVIVAKARSITPRSLKRAASLASRVAEAAARTTADMDGPGAALRRWFGEAEANEITAVRSAIELVLGESVPNFAASSDVNTASPTLSLLILLAFRSLRQMSSQFRASNPTWMKKPKAAGALCRFEKGLFIATYAVAARHLLESDTRIDQSARVQPQCQISVATSTSLPIKDGSVGMVIGSPPYCTRIDYAVSTCLEVAFLGCDFQQQFRGLRDSMIGTTTVRSSIPAPDAEWGSTCVELLEKVGSHPGKSSRYYLKTMLQYFSDINRSMKEVARVLGGEGHCVLVVQDSYFKELHIDLARITAEMASAHGLSTIAKKEFKSSVSMVQANPASKRYRKISSPIEAALYFRKQQVTT